MSLLESLAGGLRGAAGVLNPEISRETFQADQQNAQQQNQQKLAIVQHIQSQVQAGAMQPEAGAQILLKMGAPAEIAQQLVGGPGVDAQAKAIQLRKDAAAQKYIQNPEVQALLAKGDIDSLNRVERGYQAIGGGDLMKYIAELRAQGKPVAVGAGGLAIPDQSVPGGFRLMGGEAKPSAFAQHQKELEAQGFPPEVARPIAYGFLKVVPLANGGVQLVRVDKALQETNNGPYKTSSFAGNPRDVMSEISRIQDPAARQQAMAAFNQVGVNGGGGGGQDINQAPQDQRLPGSVGYAARPETPAKEKAPHYINNKQGSFIVGDDGVARPVVGEDGKPIGGENSLILQGGRESVFLNRILTASAQVNKDIANIIEQPISADRGIFGGRSQGKSLFEAGKESLATKMTTQDVQTYNAIATGIQRNLAAIESSGLAPSNSLMHMMDNVIFKEGDTNLTKIIKLAQTRQVVEAGLETILSNPRVPKEQKDYAEKMMKEITAAVPFTARDVMKLQTLQMTNPNASLKDVMANNKNSAQGWTQDKESRYQELLRKQNAAQ